jgi:hypothetical protein
MPDMKKARTAVEHGMQLNIRRYHRDLLVNKLMLELDPYIPSGKHRQFHEALAGVLQRNGVMIISDAEAADLGLPPKDDLGWTDSDRLALKRRHHEMISMSSPVSMVAAPGSFDVEGLADE